MLKRQPNAKVVAPDGRSSGGQLLLVPYNTNVFEHIGVHAGSSGGRSISDKVLFKVELTSSFSNANSHIFLPLLYSLIGRV